MTGPEHYHRAEALLASCMIGDDVDDQGRISETYPAYEYDPDTGRDVNTTGNALVAAQVHAALALAAATAEPLAQGYDGPDDSTIVAAWSEAIS